MDYSVLRDKSFFYSEIIHPRTFVQKVYFLTAVNAIRNAITNKTEPVHTTLIIHTYFNEEEAVQYTGYTIQCVIKMLHH